jgi:gamma-glutamyltranspeptidase/glutathione hydrolase
VAAAGVAQRGALASPEGVADLATAMARVWQHRFSMPSGNDFTGIRIEEWAEAALRQPNSAQPRTPEAGHTAHLNAVDGSGMMAALTFTHGPAWFGGRWVIPGTGVIMNGGMHNFSRPGLVRRDGRRFGISNMTPVIAEIPGGARVAIGSPGARRIPTNVALALSRHAFGGDPLQTAVSAGRLHAEDLSAVFFEKSRLGASVEAALARRFQSVHLEASDDYFGPLTAVRYAVSGAIETAVDDRATPGFAAYSSQ